jgi:hypothetical protein
MAEELRSLSAMAALQVVAAATFGVTVFLCGCFTGDMCRRSLG